MNNNKSIKIEKNLKHGYIFLFSFILIPFLIAFSIETYSKGGIKFKTIDSIPLSYPLGQEPNNSKPKLELQNLKDGFTTKDSSISVVALTDFGNEAVINNEKVSVDDSGRFERKLDLIIGGNQVTITVKNKAGIENSITLIVTREEDAQPTPNPEPIPAPTTQPNPVSPNPTPQPQPSPQPINPPPPPSGITGLKLSCSINNTHPSVGQSVGINCTVKDQDSNGVSGAFGYVTVNWKTGNSVYTLSQSDSGGNMSITFNVPNGNNTSSASGNVQVSKNGLNVSSNFNLTIQ